MLTLLQRPFLDLLMASPLSFFSFFKKVLLKIRLKCSLPSWSCLISPQLKRINNSLPVLFPWCYHHLPTIIKRLCLWMAGWLWAGPVPSLSLSFFTYRMMDLVFEAALDVEALGDLKRLQKPRCRWTWKLPAKATEKSWERGRWLTASDSRRQKSVSIMGLVARIQFQFGIREDFLIIVSAWGRKVVRAPFLEVL